MLHLGNRARLRAETKREKSIPRPIKRQKENKDERQNWTDSLMKNMQPHCDYSIRCEDKLETT